MSAAERYLTALSEVIAEANRQDDLDDVLDGVARIFVKRLGFGFCWIGLVDSSASDGGYLVGRASAGLLPPERVSHLHLPLDSQEAAVRAVRENRSLTVFPPGEGNREMLDLLATGMTQAYVPIPGPRSAQGVIGVAYSRERSMTDADWLVLRGGAQQVSLVLKYTRLLDRAHRDTTRWAGVAAVSERLHGCLSLSDVLNAVAQGVVDVLGFRLAAINVREGNEYRVAAVAGSPDARKSLLGMRVPYAEFAEILRPEFRVSNSYLIRHGQVDWSKVSIGARIYHSRLEHDLNGPEYWHPDDMLLVPMYRGKEHELIGILSVDEPVDGLLPNINTIRVLETFANQAAVAISNAQLFGELETRNQELAEFAYSVTHDLKTPLTTVRGYAEALSMLYGDQLGPEGQSYAQKIQDGVDRMAVFIDDLLMLTRATRLSE
ncbi:MAG: GAF domain-containing protein, partial [Anaerolineae bacterium]|nr:GAF domain-containing protein [Anaerolineae bacterium]